jgi:hypothetical protein
MRLLTIQIYNCRNFEEVLKKKTPFSTAVIAPKKIFLSVYTSGIKRVTSRMSTFAFDATARATTIFSSSLLLRSRIISHPRHKDMLDISAIFAEIYKRVRYFENRGVFSSFLKVKARKIYVVSE